MSHDPILEEVLKHRKELEDATGNTVAGLFAYLRQWRKENPEPKVTDAMIQRILEQKKKEQISIQESTCK